jgi:ParB-like chromosome segregation protein Spo0J
MEKGRRRDAKEALTEIQPQLGRIKELLKELEPEDRIPLLNEVRKQLQEVSPLSDPVDLVQWIPAEKVYANDYNPNRVAPIEMELLYTSIRMDGFTQPIVAYRQDDDHYEITDGFHRNRIGRERSDILQRTCGCLPISVIDKPLDERIGSTIRHNRARGTHQIRSMSEIVLSLTQMGWDDEKIALNLGMEPDEILRLKQITGLKQAFQDHEFSKSWLEFEKKYYKRDL